MSVVYNTTPSATPEAVALAVYGWGHHATTVALSNSGTNTSALHRQRQLHSSLGQVRVQQRKLAPHFPWAANAYAAARQLFAAYSAGLSAVDQLFGAQARLDRKASVQTAISAGTFHEILANRTAVADGTLPYALADAARETPPDKRFLAAVLRELRNPDGPVTTDEAAEGYLMGLHALAHGVFSAAQGQPRTDGGKEAKLVESHPHAHRRQQELRTLETQFQAGTR